MWGSEWPGHILGKSLEANAAYQVLPLRANAELCLCASFLLSACHSSLLIGSPTQLLSFNLLSSRQDLEPSRGQAERASLLARPTRPSHQHNASAPAGMPTGTLGTTRYLSDWDGGPGTHILTLFLPRLLQTWRFVQRCLLLAVRCRSCSRLWVHGYKTQATRENRLFLWGVGKEMLVPHRAQDKGGPGKCNGRPRRHTEEVSQRRADVKQDKGFRLWSPCRAFLWPQH